MQTCKLDFKNVYFQYYLKILMIKTANTLKNNDLIRLKYTYNNSNSCLVIVARFLNDNNNYYL